MNANDATLTALTTAQTGSTVADTAPNAPANPGFDLILAAAAGSALGSCGARYTLTISAIDLTTAAQAWPARTCQQAFDPGHGWELSGPGPDYQCTQTFPVTSCSTWPRWSATAPRSSQSSAATPSSSSDPSLTSARDRTRPSQSQRPVTPVRHRQAHGSKAGTGP